MLRTLDSSARGTRTRSSRIAQLTTSTMSRLLAPRSFMDLSRVTTVGSTLSTIAQRWLRTMTKISSLRSAMILISLRLTLTHDVRAALASALADAHQVVEEFEALVHHDHLPPDRIHQSAAQGQGSISDVLGGRIAILEAA